MIEQITKGIRISVSTQFDGTVVKDYISRFVFSYRVSIKNTSNDTVQIISRYWEVLDALDCKDIIEGEGVLGKKPTLMSGDEYVYTSGCLLESPFGAMKGYYNMISLYSTKVFQVFIPEFKLFAPFALN